MTTVPFTEEPLRVIAYDKLQAVVREAYPFLGAYDFVLRAHDGGYPNDRWHHFDVSARIDGFDLAAWDRAIATAAEPGRADDREAAPGVSNHEVLNRLCRDGRLPPGRYLVRVSW